MKAHPTAIVSKEAEIAEDAIIGPYTIIEEGVVMGPGCIIGPHNCICSGTIMGEKCRTHMGVVLGDEPQDLSFKGGKSTLAIGNNNRFREYVTVHRGTEKGSSTKIGNDNYFMALVHIAHNCQIADGVIVANNSLLGGYVEVGDKAFISAGCMIHQFVRVGSLSLLAGGVRINRDLPPFMMADNDNTVTSYNVVGAKRAGFDANVRNSIKEVFRKIYRSELNLNNALKEIESEELTDETRQMVEFIRSSKRGICFGRSNRVITDK